MQKVSKQSLAMLALSILLAISVALTLTFAALSDTKTATGTITFSQDVGLIYDGLTGGSDANDVAFTITYGSDGAPTLATSAATDLSSVTLKLASTSAKADVAAKIQYYAGSTEVTSASNSTLYTAIAKYIKLSTASWSAKTAGGTIDTLGNIINATTISDTTDYSTIVDAAAQISQVVITFTATAAA